MTRAIFNRFSQVFSTRPSGMSRARRQETHRIFATSAASRARSWAVPRVPISPWVRSRMPVRCPRWAIFLRIIFLEIFLRVFEVFVLPDIFAEQGFVHAAGVDDDVGFVERLEVGAAEIKRCGLQSVEHEAGGFGVELAGEREAHDLHEADLDGVRVLEDGEVEGGTGAAGAGGVDDDALIVPLLVKIAEAVAPQRRRFALRAIGLDVLGARNVGTIHGGTPLPPGLLE